MFASFLRRAAVKRLPSVATFSTRAAQALPNRAIGLGIAACTAGMVAAYSLKHSPLAAEMQRYSVLSWGFGQFGQLGHGGINDEILPRKIDEFEEEDCVYVAAGGNTTAVITSDGSLWTFGQGENDQLGHGVTSASPNESIPRSIEDLDDEKIVNVAVGVNHCAAVSESGHVYSWGRESMGRLGHQNPNPGCPSRVHGLDGVKIVKVCVGNQHSLALSDKGEVYAWGCNKQRCLGIKDTIGVVNKAVKVQGLEGVKVKDISCGLESSCCLSDKGEVFTWGNDDYGQLGHGSGSRYVELPTKIKSIRHVNIEKVVCGEYHCLALSDKHEVYSWGRGNVGQTCNPKCNDTNTPKMVEQLKNYTIVDIAAGGGHSACIDSQGVLYTFGRGRHGQLGRGDQVESIAAYRVDPTPVEYLFGKKVKQVACGADHTIALVE